MRPFTKGRCNLLTDCFHTHVRAESASMHTGAIASFAYFLSEVREAYWISGSQVITNLLLRAGRKHLQYILEY